MTSAELPYRWRELYEERAAIREFDGNVPREQAESEALAEIVQMMEREECSTIPAA